MSTNKKTGNKFIEREFKEVKGGYYDDYGFYYTPNGSKSILSNIIICIKIDKMYVQVSGMKMGITSIERDSIKMVADMMRILNTFLEKDWMRRTKVTNQN